MKQLTGIFSSDSRVLYTEDIYRVLALPSKSVVHFRYDRKYVDEDIRTDYGAYTNTECVIFFLVGNDLVKEPTKQEPVAHSIRKAIIREISTSVNTDLFHLFLELGDFYDCSITTFREHDKFVSKIGIEEGPKHKWIDRVKAVKNSFQKAMFFRYELQNIDGTTVFPCYEKTIQSAVYDLEDESSYLLKCSFFDEQEGQSFLKITDSDLIKVHYKDQAGIGAVVDDRQYALSTGTIIRSCVSDELRFSPAVKDQDISRYEVVSLVRVKRKHGKAACFGLVSSIAFLSVLLTQVFANMVKNSEPICDVLGVGLLALLLFGVSAAVLFAQFNKK